MSFFHQILVAYERIQTAKKDIEKYFHVETYISYFYFKTIIGFIVSLIISIVLFILFIYLIYSNINSYKKINISSMIISHLITRNLIVNLSWFLSAAGLICRFFYKNSLIFDWFF